MAALEFLGIFKDGSFFLAGVLESLMILSFGISWPMSIARSLKSKSTKGKSVQFTIFIALGYACGIASKLMMHNYNLAFWFYIPNFVMVTTDICLYYRNRAFERSQEQAGN